MNNLLKPCKKCGANAPYLELENNAGICDICENSRKSPTVNFRITNKSPEELKFKKENFSDECAHDNLKISKNLMAILGYGTGAKEMIQFIVAKLNENERLISALHGRVSGGVRMAALTDKRLLEIWVNWFQPAEKSTRITDISSVVIEPKIISVNVIIKTKTESICYESVWENNAKHFVGKINEKLFGVIG